MVNVGNGGFISTNDPELVNNSSYILKTIQSSPVTCAGLVEEIKFAPENLVQTINACDFLKKNIESCYHQDKSGINVTIPINNPKSVARLLREEINVINGGMITTCPRYDRINHPAVCLEIKNLDIKCLTNENLEKIAEIVNKLIN